MKKVRIQLKWYPNAAFTGIFVAKEKGYFADEGIDVEIIPGAPGVNVDDLITYGYTDFGVSSLGSTMQHHQRGLPIISIAQIFQGSSQGIATLKSSGINTISKLRGKTIGSFAGVNELQLFAFLNKFNLSNQVYLVLQESINELLTEQIDVGSIAMYNQLQPPYEKGLEPKDLNIVMFSQVGVGMLEDTIVANKELVDNNPELCVGVVRAILRGWRDTFTSPSEAIDITMKYVPKDSSTREHQAYMLRSVEKFIKPKGFDLCDIGRFIPSTITRTANILYKYGLVESSIKISDVIKPSIVQSALEDCDGYS